MKKTFLIWALLLFCVIAVKGFTHAEDLKTEIAPKAISKSEVELRSSMRMLWESRATLLRAYIVSEMNDSRDINEARDKLLKNAGDLGNSINPYYGSWAGSFLTGFLKKDVMLTKKVIEAAKKVNERSMDLTAKAKEQALDMTGKAKEEALALTEKGNKEAPKDKEEAFDLIKKAKEIAMDLIKKAKQMATDMLYKHLDFTWGEIESILKEDKGKDLDYYEKDKAHMVMFSNVLVNGLIKRFPEKFMQMGPSSKVTS